MAGVAGYEVTFQGLAMFQETAMINGRSATSSELLAGIKAELPILLGVVPFGMIYGILGLAAGMTPLQTQAMSAIVFAGSAQFIGAQLIGVAAPIPVIWLTTFIINVRHMLYSTALGCDMQHLSRRWRWLLAYLLTDEAYAVTALHYADRERPLTHKHYYYLGAGFALWFSWQMSTAVGVFLSAEIPASWALDFTLALTFIGLVVPALNDQPNWAAAITSGVVAVLGSNLPYKLGLFAAALSGIIVGIVFQNTQLRRKK
jgi:4-azaleucine resistance transporter AzlC